MPRDLLRRDRARIRGVEVQAELGLQAHDSARRIDLLGRRHFAEHHVLLLPALLHEGPNELRGIRLNRVVDLVEQSVERIRAHLRGWRGGSVWLLSLIHISEPTRRTPISYAVF